MSTTSINQDFTNLAKDLGLTLFTEPQIRTIHNAVAVNRSEQSRVSYEKFDSVISFLHGKFGDNKKPPVSKKEPRSTIRKAYDRAFSIIRKEEEPTIESLSIRDGYRTMIPTPMSSLNALMDFTELASNKRFNVGHAGNIQVEILDVENGIMNPESRKCGIPNFDLALKISYMNYQNEKVSFKAEIQFPLVGTQKLFKQSRDAYDEYRTLKNELAVYELALEENSSIASEENLQNAMAIRTRTQELQQIRTDSHDQIREDFGLNKFAEQRNKILSRFQSGGPSLRLVANG